MKRTSLLYFFIVLGTCLYSCSNPFSKKEEAQILDNTKPQDSICNTITYFARKKLPETSNPNGMGFHINAFDIDIVNHSFSNGQGVITFADEVTEIGDRAFYYSLDLISIDLPSSITLIGGESFCGCEKLESISIPNSVITIQSRAFWLCIGLKSVSLGNSIRRIESIAFGYCRQLRKLTIPPSVTSIGNRAFSSNHALTDISVVWTDKDSLPKMGERVFDQLTMFGNEAAILHVPSGTKNIYKRTDVWKDFIKIQEDN